jgi:hypothetical protein
MSKREGYQICQFFYNKNMNEHEKITLDLNKSPKDTNTTLTGKTTQKSLRRQKPIYNKKNRNFQNNESKKPLPKKQKTLWLQSRRLLCSFFIFSHHEIRQTL